MQVMMLAAGTSPPYMPYAASGDSSSNGAPGIDQRVDAIARQELAARKVPLPRLLAAAARDLRRLRAQVRDELAHQRRVGAEVLARGSSWVLRVVMSRARFNRKAGACLCARRRKRPSNLCILHLALVAFAQRVGTGDRGSEV